MSVIRHRTIHRLEAHTAHGADVDAEFHLAIIGPVGVRGWDELSPNGRRAPRSGPKLDDALGSIVTSAERQSYGTRFRGLTAVEAKEVGGRRGGGRGAGGRGREDATGGRAEEGPLGEGEGGRVIPGGDVLHDVDLCVVFYDIVVSYSRYWLPAFATVTYNKYMPANGPAADPRTKCTRAARSVVVVPIPSVPVIVVQVIPTTIPNYTRLYQAIPGYLLTGVSLW